MRCAALWLVLFLALAGCVPATPPPHLGATPGVAVVVRDDRYEGERFSAAYPNGWRVITSPAGEEPFVIFAAPDNCAVIILSLTAQPAPEPAGCADSTWREATETHDGTPVIHAALRASIDTWADAEAAFAQVVASITTRSSSR